MCRWAWCRCCARPPPAPAKDLGYYQTMAADAGAQRAIAAAVLGTLESAVAQTEPGTLLPELSRVLSAGRA